MHRPSFAPVVLAALALLAACGQPSSASPAPVAEAGRPAPVVAVSAPPPPVAVAAAPVPAGPAVERTPLTLLVTGDVWGEYAPCG